MADVVRGMLASEADTDVLFEKFTIEQIRDIEKKTRIDIERKKEDLRQMVGERYRELIEAADTITEMKNSSQNVMKSVASMQDYCQSLKHKHLIKGSRQYRVDSNKKREDEQFYGIATQIKLLLDMPEKIWSAIDTGDYLLATQLFILARHINMSLQLDSTQAAKIHAWFPVLTRQWAAISHFKATILQGCRDMLKNSSVSEKVTAECLCSILLLEDSNPRQVFNEFLLVRTNAVQQLFQPDNADSVKSQVCNVVCMITTTVHQIHAIFSDGSSANQPDNVSGNLLMQTLENVLNRSDGGSIIGDMKSSVAMKYLPEGLINFRPTLKTPANAISSTHLQENSLQWVNACIQAVNTGVARLLNFVTSVKGIANIRDAVWNLLQQDKLSAQWESVCQQVMKRSLSVWEEFIRPIFLERTKAIIQGQLDGAVNAMKQQTGKVLTDLVSDADSLMQCERDLSCYIWVESPHDVPPNTAWLPAHNKNMADCGGLMMKAKAYTPTVQSLCKNFDARLSNLLEDTNHYLVDEEKPKSHLLITEPEKKDKSKEVFDRFANNKEIQSFLQSACESAIQRLLQHVQEQLEAAKSELASTEDIRSNTILIDRILLLGRLTAAISELCPNLHQCMLGVEKEKTEGTRLTKKMSSWFKSKSPPVEDTKWSKMKTSLSDSSQTAFRYWSEYLSKCLVAQFKASLLDTSGQTLLLCSTRWDETEIQEETEDGRTVKSTIRVPMQASWYVQSLLFSLCQEINRIGGHALSRSVLLRLVRETLDGLLEAYGSVLEQSKSSNPSITLNQTRALQLLFDIRFLTNIMARKEDTEENKKLNDYVTSIVDRLESYVDPFDLDVFAPHVKTNLARQTQRSLVIYGALTTLDKQTLYSAPRASQAGQQEQHNVLPLATGQNRFALLPLSSNPRSTSGTTVPQPRPKLPSVHLDSGPSSPPPIIQPAEETGSFLGAMSTIWFSNISSKVK